jgi:hypothetical protein
MDRKEKLAKVLELLIAERNREARLLLHKILVEYRKELYENI